MLVLQDRTVLGKMVTNLGNNVMTLSEKNPILLIFLRHLGCMFCKEALSDLQRLQGEISQKGTEIVLVHMTDEGYATSFFNKYDFKKVQHISDPASNFYREFGLVKGDFRQLFGFTSFFGMGRAAAKGNFPSRTHGDPHQMPGIFLVNKGEIMKSFFFKSVGDYPDYLQLASL